MTIKEIAPPFANAPAPVKKRFQLFQKDDNTVVIQRDAPTPTRREYQQPQPQEFTDSKEARKNKFIHVAVCGFEIIIGVLLVYYCLTKDPNTLVKGRLLDVLAMIGGSIVAYDGLRRLF